MNSPPLSIKDVAARTLVPVLRVTRYLEIKYGAKSWETFLN